MGSYKVNKPMVEHVKYWYTSIIAYAMQEKTRIEWRMKLRQEARFAVMKVEEEEEARSDCKYENLFSVEARSSDC